MAFVAVIRYCLYQLVGKEGAPALCHFFGDERGIHHPSVEALEWSDRSRLCCGFGSV
jgi:hypothetical protein